MIFWDLPFKTTKEILKIKKYHTYLKALLLGLVLIFVGLFISKTDFGLVKNYLAEMPFTFLIVIGLSFGAYVCATYAWSLCLGVDKDQLSFKSLFMMRHVSEMLTLFNPTSVVAGEGLKMHYLKGKGISTEKGMSSILISRILIILSAILLSILSAVYLVLKAIGFGKGLGLALLMSCVLVALGYGLARLLLHSKLYTFRFFSWLQKRLGSRIISRDLLLSIKEINGQSYTFYKHSTFFFYSAFALSILHWIFGSLEFYFILSALNYSISVVDGLSVEMGVVLFKTVGAFVPGQIGVEELGNKVMLDTLGIHNAEVLIVVSILRRARQIFWIIIAFVFSLLIKRLKPDKNKN